MRYFADNHIEKLSLVANLNWVHPFSRLICTAIVHFDTVSLPFGLTPVKWSRNWSCYYPLDLELAISVSLTWGFPCSFTAGYFRLSETISANESSSVVLRFAYY